MSKKKIKVPPGMKLIFRASKTCPRTGKVMYAKDYGLKAWPLFVEK